MLDLSQDNNSSSDLIMKKKLHTVSSASAVTDSVTSRIWLEFRIICLSISFRAHAQHRCKTLNEITAMNRNLQTAHPSVEQYVDPQVKELKPDDTVFPEICSPFY